MRTAPPPIEITHMFPELHGMARRTVRLHPRLAPDPGSGASKMGGLFLWPADEPWPTCPVPEAPLMEEQIAMVTQPGADGAALMGEVPVGHALHNDYLVGVLQLRQEEVPGLDFFPGSDLLQLLWCPRVHPEEYGPYCRIYWRRAAAVPNPLAHAPESSRPDGELLPPTCILTPEQVLEYPPFWSLPDDLQGRIQAWETSDVAQGLSYHFQLSTAPGTKAGGYGEPTYGWPERPCPVCGAVMDYLLTIASVEGGAVEAGGRWDAEPQPAGQLFMIGRGGDLTLFICRRHAGEWPIDWSL